MQYNYKIAGLTVHCELPFPIIIQEESTEFIQSSITSAEADLKLIFLPIDKLPSMPQGGHWEIDQYHLETAEGYNIFYCPTRMMQPYACVSWKRGKPDTLTCHYVKGKEFYLNYSHNLCDLLGLESLLLRYSGLLIHSSFIRWGNKGILFSAPSGTGKSTQADLWEKYENAEILNGDRAGIRRISERWIAYGLPYSGSSSIYRNECAPIFAVVVLKQGKKNQIQRLTSAQAFRSLFPEIITHSWDKKFVENVTEMLCHLVTEIPIYQLACLPDESAVWFLKETLERLPIKGG